MKKFLIFCFALVRISAIFGFIVLVAKNHPFMAFLLLFIVFSTSLDIEEKGHNQ